MKFIGEGVTMYRVSLVFYCYLKTHRLSSRHIYKLVSPSCIVYVSFGLLRACRFCYIIYSSIIYLYDFDRFGCLYVAFET